MGTDTIEKHSLSLLLCRKHPIKVVCLQGMDMIVTIGMWAQRFDDVNIIERKNRYLLPIPDPANLMKAKKKLKWKNHSIIAMNGKEEEKVSAILLRLWH